MQKKELIALADYLRDHPDIFGAKQIEALADFCRSQNPLFKRQRWLDYVAGDGGPNGGRVRK